jgi:hypothetical protein
MMKSAIRSNLPENIGLLPEGLQQNACFGMSNTFYQPDAFENLGQFGWRGSSQLC